VDQLGSSVRVSASFQMFSEGNSRGGVCPGGLSDGLV